MPELFRPIAAEQLTKWVFDELGARNSVFGIPRAHWYVPRPGQPYRSEIFGQALDTPFGPAAGPHTQMAQNIVAAWLCGARYIELKTVQTLDELDVSKPCIDMEDEGYNVEWSQELKIPESVDEYLRAWVLIHALHHEFGFDGERPNVVFNLSVGYDLAGLQRPNMQWFLDSMQDASERLPAVIDAVATRYPAVRDLDIPARISDNVTLSTMHGCPPDEIGRIAAYLLEERGLHTLVKCNPTLLGPGRVRGILNDELGFRDIVVPDVAFEHDLKFDDAVPMLAELRDNARACGREFGVKLTNTLEVENHRDTFDAKEKMMYLSGPPLHALSVNVAERLSAAFDGDLLMSFSAGANCFNTPALLAAGMRTVTTCSDLLKTGGYLRLLDYIEHTDRALAEAGAGSIEAFILHSADGDDARSAARQNLERYAAAACRDERNQPNHYVTGRSKTHRELGLFDCVAAPCVDACPLDQKAPQYLRAVGDGDVAEAQRVVLRDNPLPCILGRACDHKCEEACVRVHLDAPVAIRNIKRYIMDRQAPPVALPTAVDDRHRVAVIGAGPGGFATATTLAEAGMAVEVFEQHDYAGGMTSGAVPAYRLPGDVVARDFGRLDELGVPVHYGRQLGRNLDLAGLQQDGFDRIVIMVGAQLGKPLPLEGKDCEDVVDALEFLRATREDGPAANIGRRVGVIGAGDTAMDCARVAWRRPGTDVTLIYRRTIDQMPADHEEIEQLTEEGIRVLELAKPQQLKVEDGRLRGLVCRRMAYGGERDASGRKLPHEVPGEDFEVELDTLIIAIGQQATLDCLGGVSLAVNDRGYLAVDPETFETSVPGIYAGGDAANDGPDTIVKAAAAGKAIARSILDAATAEESPVDLPDNVADLVRRRSHRVGRSPTPCTPVDGRHNFDEVVLTLEEGAAREEASRCLDCDRWCNICVGVCPNLAMQSYQSTGGGRQWQQVLVLADLCNECGNCRTFCPTAGSPSRDKPRLFGHRNDFEGEAHNAFLFSDGGRVLEARWHGATHRLATGEPADTATEPFATMHMLLHGVRDSAPWLPGLQLHED
jgi:putative selenate reductase